MIAERRETLQVAAGEFQERRPVGTRGVAIVVLAEANVAADQRRPDGRKLSGSKVFLSQKLVYWPCAYRCKEHAPGIHPPIPLSCAAADENRARGAQGDEFMGIHRQIIRR